jgi:hypothetical protein
VSLATRSFWCRNGANSLAACVLPVTTALSLAELSDLFDELGDHLGPEDDPQTVLLNLGTGPCVDALIEAPTYNAGDLRTDPRWPEFGRRAVESTGIVSMLSFRLYQESHRDVIAGLNMYSHRPNAFDVTSETIGLLLATHGAAVAVRAQAEQRVKNLEIALKTSREIGIAMGILMQASKITRDQAFDLLRIASQHTHRKLAEIAADVADTGRLLQLPNQRA